MWSRGAWPQKLWDLIRKTVKTNTACKASNLKPYSTKTRKNGPTHPPKSLGDWGIGVRPLAPSPQSWGPQPPKAGGLGGFKAMCFHDIWESCDPPNQPLCSPEFLWSAWFWYGFRNHVEHKSALVVIASTETNHTFKFEALFEQNRQVKSALVEIASAETHRTHSSQKKRKMK